MAKTRLKIFDGAGMDLYSSSNTKVAQIKNVLGKVLMSGHDKNTIFCCGSGNSAALEIDNYILSGRVIEMKTIDNSSYEMSTSRYQFKALTTDATPLEFARFTVPNQGVYNFEGDALIYCTSESAPTGEAEFGAYLQFNTTYRYRSGFTASIPSDEVVVKQSDFSSGTPSLQTSAPTTSTVAFKAVGLNNRNLTWHIDIKRKEVKLSP